MASPHRQPGRVATWAILILAAGAWAAEDGPDRTRLLCALPADVAPASFSDQGKASGYAVEVLDEVARRSGLRLEYVFGRPWDEFQAMLLDRRVDLIASLVVGDERRQRLIFTSTLESVTITFLVRAEQAADAGPQPGMRVGIIDGCVSDEPLATFPDSVVARFGSQQQLLLELLAGRLDLAIGAKANLRKLVDDAGLTDRIRFLEPPVREAKRVLALRPEDAALRDRLDAALAGFVGTPAYQAIYERWWGQPQPWWTPARVARVMGALLVIVAVGLLGWRFNSLRRANRALRRSEALLQQSQRIALIGHYVLDTTTGRWTSSETLDDIFGITAGAERSVEAWERLLHPDDRTAMIAYLREHVLARQQGFDREYRIVRPSDASVRWVHGLGTIELAAGQVVRMFGTIQDITERKRSAALERESSLRLEALFQGARDAIFIADPVSGTILEVNRQAEALLGRPRHELLGIHQSLLHPVDRREAIRLAFAEHSAGASRPVESAVLHQDGSSIPVEINGSVVILPDGRRLIMGMFRDIRERVRLQEQLQQSEKLTAIGQLAGGVAHDFNNQLTGISGYAELLAANLADPQQRGWAAGILGAAQRAAELTRQLLAFARKGQSQRAPTDLNLIISEMADLLRRSIDARIRIGLRLADRPCLVLGDPGQLHHALLNLAINARDAMPLGGELSISTSHRVPAGAARPFIEIVVGDTGCGMSAEILRHVFEPFFTTKEVGKGTGLGLAAVYGVIQNHGGTITVASAPGQGSTFTIHLPLLEAPAAAPAGLPAPAHIAAPGSAERHILVVDDEAVVRSITGEMLRSLGFAVTCCASGEQALVICRQDATVDLVILDLVMPQLGGRDAFIALRAARPGLRIVLASGHSLNGEVQAILDLGALGFLQKPFLLADLARTVGAALRQGPATSGGGAGDAVL